MVDIIVTLMQEEGYPADNEGICEGLAKVAARAHACGEFDKFAKRLEFLNAFKDKKAEFKRRLEKVKRKNAVSSRAYRINQGIQGIAPLAKEEEELLQEQSDAHEKEFLEIDAFFFGISSYFDPVKVQKFLELRGAHFSQLEAHKAEEWIYDRVLDPDPAVEVRHAGAEAKPVLPLNQPDIFLLFSQAEKSFQHEQLKSFLEAVQTSGVSGGLVIGSNNHAVYLFYDSHSQGWCLTNHSNVTLSLSIHVLLINLVPVFTKNTVANLAVQLYTNDLTEKEKKAALVQELGRISADSLTQLCESKEIDRADSKGVSPLHLAARQGRLDVVQALLENGADTNLKDINQETALHLAAQYGHLEVVRCLLEKGARVDEQNKEGISALYFAAQNGHADIVRLFLENGADANQKTKGGIHPLYIAAAQGHIDVIKLLLEKRADINQKTTSGSIALDIAIENGHVGVAEYLMKQLNIDTARLTEKDKFLLEGNIAFKAGRFTEALDKYKAALDQPNENSKLGKRLEQETCKKVEFLSQSKSKIAELKTIGEGYAKHLGIKKTELNQPAEHAPILEKKKYVVWRLNQILNSEKEPIAKLGEYYEFHQNNKHILKEKRDTKSAWFNKKMEQVFAWASDEISTVLFSRAHRYFQQQANKIEGKEAASKIDATFDFNKVKKDY